MGKPTRAPRISLAGWVRKLAAQPPGALYRRAAVYRCGDEMEIEHFSRVLEYDTEHLIVELGTKRYSVWGSGLILVSMEKDRLILRGTVIRTELADR